MSRRPYTAGDDPDYTATLEEEQSESVAWWMVECNAIELGLIPPPRDVVQVDADEPPPF